MLRADWDCLVCSQPNSVDSAVCVSCECPFDCDADDLDRRKQALAKQLDDEISSMESIQALNIKHMTPMVPSSKYMGIFPSMPTVSRSILIFTAIYFLLLAVAIALVRAFELEPDKMSSAVYGAMIAAAMAVGEYWKRSNMLSALRREKWTVILTCFGITLVADALTYMFGIDIHGVQFSSSIALQKLGHLGLLWLALGTNSFVSDKGMHRSESSS